MEVPVSIPTDLDGFIQRECPTCEKKFKWHVGPIDREAEDEPTTGFYFCPLCGEQADKDQWWTPEQLEFAKATAMPELLRQLAAEIPGLTVTQSAGLPPMLTEPNDMQIVVPPCHDYEPVKVPDVRDSPFFCLVCGSEFVV